MPAPTRGGALWLDNWVLSATIANVSSQHVNYPAKHLLNARRCDAWASLNATNAQAVVFDLGEPRLPACLAIAGANFTGGTAIRLRGSDDDGSQLANAVFYDLALYAPDPIGQVVRWYIPATSTFGTVGPRRYWGVRLIPGQFGSYNTPDPWFELSNVWLGEYVPLEMVASARVRARNPSARTHAYGRAMWSDPLSLAREAEVTVGGLTPAAWCALEARIRAQGTREVVLDLNATVASGTVANGGCLYGRFPEEPITGGDATSEVGAAERAVVPRRRGGGVGACRGGGMRASCWAADGACLGLVG